MKNSAGNDCPVFNCKTDLPRRLKSVWSTCRLCFILWMSVWATMIAGLPAQAQDSDVEADGKSAPQTAAEDETKESLPPAPLPIPLRPYVVHVEIACPHLASLPSRQAEQLLQQISDGIVRMYGSMWTFDVVFTDWLLPGREMQLRNLSEADLHQRFGDTDFEKVMLLSIEQVNGGHRVSCREYDVRVQELTPVQSSFSIDPAMTGPSAARLIRDSFRPVAFLASSAQGTDVLEFFLQAGELVPPDESAAQIAEGDILRPFLRHMERRDPKKLRLLQRLDLTYIRVTEFNQRLVSTGLSAEDQEISLPDAAADPNAEYIDRGRITGVLISHGMAPFGGRGRNVEQLALRQRPMTDSSEVQLVLKAREDRPLVCYRVDRVAKLRYKDESLLPAERVVSDREGKIRISVDNQNPTFWLYVYSGSLLLARVPYAPGLVETDVILLPDDSIRLGVEGELYLFRDQLVDVVAQQAVFKGMAKQAAAKGEVAKLEEAVKGMESLPGKKDFDAQLNAIRRPAIDRAKELRNRGAERNVNRLCDAMATSLDKFFASDKLVKQMQEIQQLRSLAAQRAAAAAAGN